MQDVSLLNQEAAKKQSKKRKGSGQGGVTDEWVDIISKPSI